MRGEEKDETAEEFFAALKIPENWRFLGQANIRGESFGRAYGAEKGVIFRVYYTSAARGGICKRDDTTGVSIYRCIASNKTSEKLNLFIEANF